MKTSLNSSALVNRSIMAACALLGPAMFCGPAQAQASVTGLCNTGWNAGCTAILATTGGVPDPNYFLTANPNGSPGPAIVVNTFTFPISPGPWLPDTTVSHWIGPVADQEFGAGCCTGSLTPYVYRDAFTFAGTGTVAITGRWAADNEASMFLDGSTFTGAPSIVNSGTTAFGTWHSFSISLSNLAPGNHFLDFRVTNFSNATGLRVEYLSGVTAVVPEPSTMASLCVGLLALTVVARRRASRPS